MTTRTFDPDAPFTISLKSLVCILLSLCFSTTITFAALFGWSFHNWKDIESKLNKPHACDDLYFRHGNMSLENLCINVDVHGHRKASTTCDNCPNECDRLFCESLPSLQAKTDNNVGATTSPCNPVETTKYCSDYDGNYYCNIANNGINMCVLDTTQHPNKCKPTGKLCYS